MVKKATTTKKEKKEETAPAAESKKKETAAANVFKGKYIPAIGRRKTAMAQIRLYKEGDGKVIINGRSLEKYFPETLAAIAVSPIRLAGLVKDADVSVLVRGGGLSAQAQAVRHGLARVLVGMDAELKGAIKAKGWLTRDSRKVERKKPGLKKARRAPQWSKR